MEMKFESYSFGKRMKSMLSVDFRRMFTMPLLYIMTGTSLVIPILVMVMTTMFDGSTSVNPQTGVETTIQGFENTWQGIAGLSGAPMSMDLTSMCNINLVYFMLSVLVCIFIAADFRSGYAKNLFAVRAKKSDYVISKTLVGFVGGVIMLLAYFIGTMLGGAIAGLPFDTGVAGVNGVVMCMLAKTFLLAVFVAIYVLLSVIVKEKLWASIVGSLMVGMLLFMMIPMLTPLDAGIANVVMCLIGGVLFCVGLGAISNVILKKKNIL
ncbi:MAG: hypothetical protein IJZ23_03805 [Roseburia sp.]|nr:hypothetical protein [Roseburia sp.]